MVAVSTYDAAELVQEPQHSSVLKDGQRLASLLRSELMDTAREEAFQRATRLATRLLGVPISLLSLVDDTRQFFKADTGLDGALKDRRGTSLDESFCQYVVSSDAPLKVADARAHPRLKYNGSTLKNGIVAYLGVPVRAPDGQTIGSFCAIHTEPRSWSDEDQQTLADIAETVQNEIVLRQNVAERQLVVRELNHRVKNLFAVVGGMITMTARSSADTSEMSASLQARLFALATAHNLIMPAISDKPDQLNSVSLQTLLATIVEPHISFPNDRITLDGPTVQIGGKPTTNLALALHEMATNAAKYGALARPNGWVEVTWQTSGNDLVIDWVESGADVPDDRLPPTGGFGSKLIKASIEGHLNGRIDSRWGDAGMHHHIVLPLRNLEG